MPKRGADSGPRPAAGWTPRARIDVVFLEAGVNRRIAVETQ